MDAINLLIYSIIKPTFFFDKFKWLLVAKNMLRHGQTLGVLVFVLVMIGISIGFTYVISVKLWQYHGIEAFDEKAYVDGALNTHPAHPLFSTDNRRMDEWVTQDLLDLATVEVEIPDPDPKKKKKAMMDDHDSDSDHGDFDLNALRV